MAGQKVQTSILRRVLDHTPLRPARLENFQPQALKTAQFAARYFNRENSVIQRVLNVGGAFSPIRRSIGWGVISRNSAFINSFGPVQRSYRYQPEHQPRRHSQVEDGFEAYESFETEDFGYAQEPAYFTPSEPLISQSYQADYASPAPATLPWETPLSSAPLPVARRIEFQPANLQYLLNPERPEPARSLTERPSGPVVERRVAPVFQAPAQAPSQSGRGSVTTNLSEITGAESTAQPVITNSEVQVQPGIPGQVSTSQPSITPAPLTPAAPAFQAGSSAVEREPVREYRETGYGSAQGGFASVPAQPALSRALQRTFEATAYQPGLANPVLYQAPNPNNTLGATPAAVARHFAVPATLARYRSVKQAADKAIYGEEAAFEPVSNRPYTGDASFTPVPLNYSQAPVQPVAPVSAPLPQVTHGELPEVRRVREAVQPLPETPTNFVSPVTWPTPVQQPAQAFDAIEVQAENQAAKPALLQNTAEPSGNPQPALETPASSQTAQLPVQRTAAVEAGQPLVSPDALAATELQSQRTTQRAAQPVGQTVSGRTVLQAGEAAIERTFQPGRDAGLTRFTAAPLPFDEAIPASLLGNPAVPSEERQFSGTRGNFPVVARTWANNLATLRNNPGVEARTSLPLARRLSEPASPSAESGVEAWSGGGAGVYYDRRRPRRLDTAMAADADAAETQDRIFSLAEPNPGLSSFQPQFMQTLAVETVTPAPVINRSLPVAPQTQTTSTVRPGDSATLGVTREGQSAVYREIQAAGPVANNIQARPGQTSVQPAWNFDGTAPVNQFYPSLDATIAGEVERVASEQAAPVETGSSPSDSPTRPTQTAPVANMPALEASEANAVGQPVFETGEAVQTALDTPGPGRAVVGELVANQALPVTGAATSGQFAEDMGGAGQSPGTIRAAGPQPTALQRAFKRLDLDEPGATTAFGRNTSPDFDAPSFSYTVRPGSFPHRPGQTDATADYIEFDEGASGGFPEVAYPAAQFYQPSQPLVRETVVERVVERVSQPEEATPPRPYSETQVGSSFQANNDTVARVATQGQTTSTGPDAAQVAGETGFEGLPIPTLSGVSPRTLTVTGFDTPGAVEVSRLSQPQFFANSLEPAWLTPENRFMVERLPGGSGALQRLRQAPGQLSAFLEQFRATSTPGLNLSSLSNNPGLSASVARSFDNSGPVSSSATTNNLAGNQPLSFTLRRRQARQTSQSPGDFERNFEQDGYFSFEQGPASFSPDASDYASPVQTRPEIARTIDVPANQNQPTPVQRVTAQPVSFQNNVNRETSARIQRNGVADPTQPASNSSFTITSDWVGQLQRRFAGFSVGQLSAATGQVMRFLNNEGGSLPGSAFGANTGADFGNFSGFSYAVPPLLWRKVSDYAPHNALPFNPDQPTGGQPGFSYTTPGEVLRAYEQGQTFYGQPDDGAISAETGETTNQARLELPRLEQTHRLLQRIASLENTNQSLELAHRMEAAAQANNFAPQPGSPVTPAQPGQLPLSLPRSATVQRQPDLPGATPPLASNRFSSDLEAAEAVVERFAPAAPLRMTDVPVNRPGSVGQNEEAASDGFTDDDFARPAPEIRTVEVRVPERQNYATPLEAAAARSSPNGPNIGQGEILQPLAIQRKAASSGTTQTATYAPLAQPALHNVIKTSVGRNLDTQVQRKMTGIFGSHFQDVRVHTGDEAAQATRQVGAEAFTLGSNIYFAPGRYQPDTQSGQALIGHELTHVIQQSTLPSLGGGRIPETSSLGQTLEHHAIANEQLLLRHLSNNHDDHNHHGFSSDDSGRLSYQNNYSSSSYSGGSSTVERSYQPMSEQNSHPPINPAHLRNDNASGQYIQRVIGLDDTTSQNVSSSSNSNIEDIINNQESIDKLARRVYQIMRDELMIERDRGFGPGNGKFF
ncbi:MAG: DUF4157 domain-containing protein [Chloroflexi bacterium]|nr:DUF4157 domain-containing protein [Chloroflexota bacterium]OJV89601.1 MAG: hypothetical protein BGO39_37225 [Chloroflexi bacterium 54-19]